MMNQELAQTVRESPCLGTCNVNITPISQSVTCLPSYFYGRVFIKCYVFYFLFKSVIHKKVAA
jgi:hypothetical protein